MFQNFLCRLSSFYTSSHPTCWQNLYLEIGANNISGRGNQCNSQFLQQTLGQGFNLPDSLSSAGQTGRPPTVPLSSLACALWSGAGQAASRGAA